MPTTQPTAADLHVDTLLTMLSIAYMNEADAYIADKLFPIVPVRKQSNLIPEYRKGDFFRDVAQFREPGTESRGTGFRVIKDKTYYAQNFANQIVPTVKKFHCMLEMNWGARSQAGGYNHRLPPSLILMPFI